MVEKKLLTLGCAVGILACGACFLPPSPEPKPQSPPEVRIDLTGIRTIRVEVVNGSGTHDLDPNALARGIKGRINLQAGSLRVRGVDRRGAPTGNEDAVLQVTIVSERVDPEHEELNRAEQKWDFEVKVSATLAKKDGRVVWRESAPDYRFSTGFPAVKPEYVLGNPSIQDFLNDEIGKRLVIRMLSAQ